MRIFPSIAAAIVTGFVITPITIFGWSFIEEKTGNQLLVLFWVIVAFFIPAYFSAVDREYMAKRRREEGFLSSFRAPVSRDAFLELYIPSWLRIAACFVSAGTSLMLLKIFGVRL
jgi:hypothetical protein